MYNFCITIIYWFGNYLTIYYIYYCISTFFMHVCIFYCFIPFISHIPNHCTYVLPLGVVFSCIIVILISIPIIIIIIIFSVTIDILILVVAIVPTAPSPPMISEHRKSNKYHQFHDTTRKPKSKTTNTNTANRPIICIVIYIQWNWWMLIPVH